MTKRIVKGNGSITIKADDGKITDNISTKGKTAPKPSNTKRVKEIVSSVEKEYKRPKVLNKPFFMDSLESSNGKYLITLEQETLGAQFVLTFIDKETNVRHIIPEDMFRTTVPELADKAPGFHNIDMYRLGLSDVRRLFFMQLPKLLDTNAQTAPLVSRDRKYTFTIDKDENSVLIVSYLNNENNETSTIPETLAGGFENFYSGIPDGPLSESWKLFMSLSNLKTETKVDFAKIHGINPKMKRLSNDGVDSGAAAPIYYIPNKVYDANHLPNDEVLLRWSEPGLSYEGVDYEIKTSGWALCFWGSLGSFIAFAEWNDLNGIKNLVSRVEDKEGLRTSFALSNPKVSAKLVKTD